MNEKAKIILAGLRAKYPDQDSLGKKEAADELGIKVAALSSRMRKGKDLPKYIKTAGGSSRVRFPLQDFAVFLEAKAVTAGE